ncbi:MAG: DUF192 domain-containing protein [candidate division WOR-3 bacterium]|nr:DUF192 domain-containing protein [candidate division WOR-3 bacterium]MCX7757523.1 DUF192 domain-containing protein [candidate division WOR-3 bacterium]MDW7987180.1 DUF192 domain-containing protein [candidate division WOR-3 bacterium]
MSEVLQCIFKFMLIYQIIFGLNCLTRKQSDKDIASKPNSYSKKISIGLGNKKIQVEVADTPEKRFYGLMDREFLGENEGMLFVFETSGIYSFWMKNTKIPLSIAFITDNGIITEIYEMIPYEEKISYKPSTPVRYALEMNRGWFFRNGIKAGDVVYGLPK